MSVNTLIDADVIPREVKKAFVTASDPESAEVTLWRNVAARMVLDAYGTTAVKTDFEHGQTIRLARRWLWSRSADEVFSMAGIDIARVLKQVKIDLKGDEDDEYFRRPRVRRQSS